MSALSNILRYIGLFFLTGWYSARVSAKIISHTEVSKVSRDHFLIEFGYANWAKIGTRPLPDQRQMSIYAFPWQVSVYGMYDFLIKGFPYMSVGVGAGFNWDRAYFKRTLLIIDPAQAPVLPNGTLPYADIYTAEDLYYESSNLSTVGLQAPLELRFTTRPENYNKGFKAALGIRLGYLISAYSTSKTLKNNSGQTLTNAEQIISTTDFFNNFQATSVLRIGWGNMHLFGTFSLTPLFDNRANTPDFRVWSVGIGLNGL